MIRHRARVWTVVLSVYAASLSTVLADAPPGRYTVDAGTVRDNRTGLTWQQSVDVPSYTWAGAKTYCKDLSLAGGGWRLPTRKELLTLVDPTRSEPAIDQTAFTNTPATWFWSASPYIAASGDAWYVNFSDGSSRNSGNTEYTYRVRCVHR